MSAPTMSLNQRLAAALHAGGDAPALISGAEVISYRQLRARVAAAAARLDAHGIGKGDRVAFQLPNTAHALILMLATLMVGAAPVPILPAYRERELRHILNTARPRAIAVTTGNRRFSPLRAVAGLLAEAQLPLSLKLALGPLHDDAPRDWHDLDAFCATSPDLPSALTPADMQADDTAMMLLSSGTTGLPKAIARRNGGYSYMIEEGCKVFGLSDTAVYLAVLPVSHGFVINCPGMLGTLASGGAVVLAPDTGAAASLELIAAHGVTHTTLVPALLSQWLEHAHDTGVTPHTLRYVQVGGSRLSTDLAVRAEARLGIHIQQCYGMSEGLLCFTRFDDPDTVRFNSQGRPLSVHDEVLIVDAQGKPVPCGESGELITRGPYTIHAYFNDERASLRGFTADGHYRTGDLAHVDAAGNVYIDGRVTDSINRGGEKFSPEEIEDLCKRHAKLKDAACVGMANSRYGEVPCLFAIAHDAVSVSLAEIRQYLEQAGVAAFKLPERLMLLDEIPRKGIGKIDRVSLRERANEDACQASPA